ncbi:hypothetical protein CGMCC3_g17957 [Colletotrichum fructicola]|nr:uncharacterized protein CGMCC3_g17957 [Colletotrichum fructicola]KAE9565862.1 hypothetical protein CGMCC3_g17957 [Colletotrichum fructicola]
MVEEGAGCTAPVVEIKDSTSFPRIQPPFTRIRPLPKNPAAPGSLLTSPPSPTHLEAMASQTRTIIPNSATRRQREEELVATGVLTELRMVLSSDSNPDGSNNHIGLRLALKAAVCVNAANEQSGEQPSIISSTSNERLSGRLRTAVDLKAEGLAEAGASPGRSARVVALVGFYNGSINNTPDHAYVRLSVHVMDGGAARSKWFGVEVDDVATFMFVCLFV